MEIFNYKSPEIGILCQKKLEKYNSLARDLSVKYMGSLPLLNELSDILLENLDSYQYKDRFLPELEQTIDTRNFKPSSPKATKISTCLDDSDEFSNIVKSSEELLYDILKKKNYSFSLYLDKIIALIQKNQKKIEDKVKNSVEVSGELIYLAEKSFDLVLDPLTLKIFKSFDKVKEYFEKTTIHSNLKEMNKILTCIKSNCLNTSEIVDTSDLFTDDGVIKLPIDMFSGDFRPYRLFLINDQLKLKKDQLSLIDKDYIAFNTKKEIEINKLLQRLKEMND